MTDFVLHRVPSRAQEEQDLWGLWSRFCHSAAAGRLRNLHVCIENFDNTAALMRDLAQLRDLREVQLWLYCLRRNDVGELAGLSSLSSLKDLALHLGMSLGASQPLQCLPPELAALSRLERLTGAAGRRCLPTPARMLPARSAPHALASPPPPPACS